MFEFFTGKKTAATVEELEPEFDEKKTYKSELNKERNEYARQRMRLDLERAKLENEIKKTELQNELEALQFERQRMRQARIEEFGGYGGYGDDEDGDSPDKLLSLLLTGILAKNNQPQANQEINVHGPSVEHVTQQGTFSNNLDTSLTRYWDSFTPQQKAYARTLTDEQIRTWIINHNSAAQPKEINDILAVVRSGK